MAINNVTISGNLTRDPELKGKDESILAFSVAVNESKKVGEKWEEYPNYIDCVVYGASRAAALNSILHKGMAVCVGGRIHQDRWQDKEGANRSRVCIIANDVVFMEERGGTKRSDPYDEVPFE